MKSKTEYDVTCNMETSKSEEIKDACYIIENKTYRKALDGLLQNVKSSTRQSRERSILITKLQEAIMWAGMDLKALADGATIYPDSYDPSNTNIEPTADGLKM